jgi:hypothetical protein
MTMIEQQLLFVVANQVVKLHSRPKPSMIIAVSSRTLFYSVHRQQLQYSGGDKPAAHKCRARVLVVVRCYALSTASGGLRSGTRETVTARLDDACMSRALALCHGTPLS